MENRNLGEDIQLNGKGTEEEKGGFSGEERKGNPGTGEEKPLPTQEEVLAEWIRTREESRKETLENYFKGMYPMMFVAGFFLLATAYQEGRRIRYVGLGSAGVPSLVLVTVSFVLGAGLLFMGARMMKKQKEDRMQRMQERLKAMEEQKKEQEASEGRTRAGTIAEKAALASRMEGQTEEGEGEAPEERS